MRLLCIPLIFLTGCAAVSVDVPSVETGIISRVDEDVIYFDGTINGVKRLSVDGYENLLNEGDRVAVEYGDAYTSTRIYKEVTHNADN